MTVRLESAPVAAGTGDELEKVAEISQPADVATVARLKYYVPRYKHERPHVERWTQSHVRVG